MQKLQQLLGAADEVLERQNVSLSAPIVARVGMLYQITERDYGIPLTYGKMMQLPSDYQTDTGAGHHLPQSALLQGILVDTKKAAEAIIRVTQKHDRSMAAMESMCHKYLTHIFPP